MHQTAESRSWPLIVLLCLVPLWCVGLFGRNYWTPDEPREADIAWRMSQQSDRTLPMLAERPFLEKPPLTYWMSGGAMTLLGASPAAARLPNLLYAMVAALAVGAIGFSMGGNRAAIVAAFSFASSFLIYRSFIWLAPDAGLLAGVSIALLGAYHGYRSPRGRRKFFWYTLMHLGAAIGFMAKSAPGMLVPALALFTVALWDRRAKELLRWELCAGFVLQATIIAPWLWAVFREPLGVDALRVLFWNNLAGRFVAVNAPLELQYADGHPNYPGKYWLELGVYMLPWSLLLLAAIRRGWHAVRSESATRAAWRFAVAATVPWLLILTASTTARDIYAGPAMVGCALLLALWASELPQELSRGDRWALRGTVALVVTILSIVVLGLITFATAAAMHKQPATSLALGAVTLILVAGTAIFATRGTTERFGWQEKLSGAFIAYVATILIGAAELMRALTPWYDLPRIAAAIHADVATTPCGLLQPDETTIAMLDYQLRTSCELLKGPASDSVAAAADWFRQHGEHSRLVVRLPGRARGEVSDLLAELSISQRPPRDGLAGELVDRQIARIDKRYDTPHGRRYALLAPVSSIDGTALTARPRSDASFPR
ncbi:MAG: glycosyltransferase family 39 protein [Proteobacteria bacterium]|nr:glycosyltransferase family 39 protein [Pseudomonadota bacterium]